MIMVVKQCAQCPFCNTLENGDRQCNISTPAKRDIPKDQQGLPPFCPIKKEQVIVRGFGQQS